MTGCALASVVTAVVIGLSLTTACARTSPGAPAPAAKPGISLESMSVAAEALSSGGYTYRVTVKLRESGGVAATIASIDLSFLDGSTLLASSRVDRPISDAANVVPANTTVDSREMTTTDSDPSHPAATSVVATVTFTDGAAGTNSATGSAGIAAPAPAAYTLSGTVSDERSARMVVGGTVQTLDGPNAGKTSSTDGNGAYSLSDLERGSFMVRATAHGYDPREQSVTLARDTTLDLKLRSIPSAPPSSPAPPPPSSCAYTVAPTENGTDYNGGTFTATISRTSGSCSWQATSDVSWITLNGATSGNGSATLTYAVGPNGLISSRSGRITLSWAGGSAHIRVQQGIRPDWECFLALDKGSQDFDNVPPAGSQLTVNASVFAVPSGWNGSCTAQVKASVPWISGGGDVRGGLPAPFTFSVAPNPSPGTARRGSIVATSGGKTQTLAVTQR
jgi:hypothetical protein